MSSLSPKRKLDEYHDPDYSQFNEAKRPKLSPAKVLSSAERIEKIKTIVRREFQNELIQKEQEINKIESRILQAKRLLHRLRYAIVANFYSKKGMDGADTPADINKSENVISGDSHAKDKQRAIHPSLKKLIGKTPINYDEILQFRPTPVRKAATAAITSIGKITKKKKDEKASEKSQHVPIMENTTTPAESSMVENTCEERLKVPRYIEPILLEKEIKSLNSARGRNQTRHLIVVGNTSKYIGDEKSIDGVTHKWLVYLRAKTELTIDNFVQKVRFFLHPSYKPNDVVEVNHPPFQLSRRGWGEFPIRIQLYFHAAVKQKPLQIIHNLILDRRMSGLQTMGAETVVELWLNLERQTQDRPELRVEPYSDLEPLKIYRSFEESSETTTMNGSVDESFYKSEEIVTKMLIKTEPERLGDEYYPPFPAVDPIVPVKIEKLNTINKNGQIYVIDPNKKAKQHKVQRNQVSLLKPNLLITPQPTTSNMNGVTSITSKVFVFLLTDHDYAGQGWKYEPPIIRVPDPPPRLRELSIFPHKNHKKLAVSTRPQTPTLDYSDILKKAFLSSQFTSIRSAVEFLLQKLPLTSHLVKQFESYRLAFPFTVESTQTFERYPKYKQFSCEWLRAKLIQKYLREKYGHDGESNTIWTAKEILIFSRMHGYVPTSSDNYRPGAQSNSQTDGSDLKLIIRNEIKREKNQIRESVTHNHEIYDWLNRIVKNRIRTMQTDEVIDVVDGEKISTVIKKEKDCPTVECSKKLLWLPLPPVFEKESEFVSEVCDRIGIRLQPEEIISGVQFPASNRMLIQVARQFVEDICRCAYDSKFGDDNHSKSIPPLINQEILVQDVYKAISTRFEYDLLTNKHLGESKIKTNT